MGVIILYKYPIPTFYCEYSVLVNYLLRTLPTKIYILYTKVLEIKKTPEIISRKRDLNILNF